ncbi:helix-turn-helix domain-containing protein [Akkermansia muciniphila]
MDNGLSYSKIAFACGVSERTVRQWISQKGIPERFSHCLKSMVESSRKTVSPIEATAD